MVRRLARSESAAQDRLLVAHFDSLPARPVAVFSTGKYSALGHLLRLLCLLLQLPGSPPGEQLLFHFFDRLSDGKLVLSGAALALLPHSLLLLPLSTQSILAAGACCHTSLGAARTAGVQGLVDVQVLRRLEAGYSLVMAFLQR